jgi:hypothetical protein
MWIRTLTFIPEIQAGASKGVIGFWKIFSDAGLALI